MSSFKRKELDNKCPEWLSAVLDGKMVEINSTGEIRDPKTRRKIMSEPRKEKHIDKKTVPLTTEQRLINVEKNVEEVARGVNLQARLLEAIVKASDSVVKKYLELVRVPAPVEGQDSAPAEHENGKEKK